jgi:hypothetical protein
VNKIQKYTKEEIFTDSYGQAKPWVKTKFDNKHLSTGTLFRAFLSLYKSL